MKHLSLKKNTAMFSALFLSMSMVIASSAQATTGAVVDNIQIRGLNRIAKGAVLLALPIREGDVVTPENTALAMKQLYATGDFDNVSLAMDGNTFIVNVVERPTIGEVDFSGNSQMASDNLRKVVEDQGLRSGEPLNVERLEQIKQSLEDFYHSAGMYQARVNVVINNLPRNRANVKFEFTEGVAAEIKQINIVGNKAFDEDVLLAQMDLRDDVPWWNFTASQKYDSTKFRADLESLRSYYMDRGYVNFKIESTSVEMTPDRKGIYLTIAINEGEQYTVNKTELRGNTLKYGEALEQAIAIESGEIYNQREVSDTEKALKDVLGKFGYANSNVKAYPIFNDQDKTVDVQFNVEPGSRVYVSQVSVTGNTTTNDTVIRREIRQMDGSWLSSEAVELSKARLNRTGYFETVDITQQKAGTTADTVNLNVNVKEQPTGAIAGGVGFGTDSGLLLQASISQSNLFGWGTRGVISAYENDYRKHMELGYTDPYYTVDNVSLGARVFYDAYEADDDGDVVDYNNDTIGFYVNTGYPISETWSINYSLGIERNEIESHGQYFEQAQYFWERFGDGGRQGDYINYKAGITLTHNSLDRSVFPTDGNRQVFKIDASVPSSDLQFYKLTAETYHYFPIDSFHNFVFAARGKVGYGDGYGTKHGYDQVLPFFENFYLGSSEWLRGFDHNSVGPRALYYKADGSTYASDSAVGGNAFWTGSLEFFMPAPFIAEAYKNQVRTSLFFDAGCLWDTNGDVYSHDYSKASDYRASAGVSLVWISPIGPMSFSLSKAIKERDGDSTQTFNFNIGSTF